jgi:hypothetical protein
MGGKKGVDSWLWHRKLKILLTRDLQAKSLCLKNIANSKNPSLCVLVGTRQ